jgi:hypothetical protein
LQKKIKLHKLGDYSGNRGYTKYQFGNNSEDKRQFMAQLKLQLIDALIQMQKIPGMANVLQPSIDALNKPSADVPDGDYKNIALLKDLIFFEADKNKINLKDHLRHAKNLIELAQRNERKYSKKSQ